MTIAEIETPGDLGDEIGSFFREKRSERISPNTIATYGANGHRVIKPTTRPPTSPQSPKKNSVGPGDRP